MTKFLNIITTVNLILHILTPDASKHSFSISMYDKFTLRGSLSLQFTTEHNKKMSFPNSIKFLR